jgi:hypothetical protein
MIDESRNVSGVLRAADAGETRSMYRGRWRPMQQNVFRADGDRLRPAMMEYQLRIANASRNRVLLYFENQRPRPHKDLPSAIERRRGKGRMTRCQSIRNARRRQAARIRRGIAFGS